MGSDFNLNAFLEEMKACKPPYRKPRQLQKNINLSPQTLIKLNNKKTYIEELPPNPEGREMGFCSPHQLISFPPVFETSNF